MTPEGPGRLPRTFVLSIDLDDLACYGAVYGRDVVPRGDDPVLACALPRLLDLLAEVHGRATFFIIGRTVEPALAAGGHAAAALARIAAEGHEVGHHGYAHDYRLVDRPMSAFEADVAAGRTACRRLGVDPVGYRFPGYTHTPAHLRCLSHLGLAYDASVLPSPPYFLLRRAVQVALRLGGRRSASHPRVRVPGLGRRRPYRDPSGLWEVPISADAAVRIPFVGTFLLSGPSPVRRYLAASARRADYLHLELHGADALDAGDPGVPPDLVRWMPELRVPLSKRLARLRSFLAWLPPPRPIRDLVADLGAKGA